MSKTLCNILMMKIYKKHGTGACFLLIQCTSSAPHHNVGCKKKEQAEACFFDVAYTKKR